MVDGALHVTGLACLFCQGIVRRGKWASCLRGRFFGQTDFLGLVPRSLLMARMLGFSPGELASDLLGLCALFS